MQRRCTRSCRYHGRRGRNRSRSHHERLCRSTRRAPRRAGTRRPFCNCSPMTFIRTRSPRRSSIASRSPARCTFGRPSPPRSRACRRARPSSRGATPPSWAASTTPRQGTVRAPTSRQTGRERPRACASFCGMTRARGASRWARLVDRVHVGSSGGLHVPKGPPIAALPAAAAATASLLRDTAHGAAPRGLDDGGCGQDLSCGRGERGLCATGPRTPRPDLRVRVGNCLLRELRVSRHVSPPRRHHPVCQQQRAAAASRVLRGGGRCQQPRLCAWTPRRRAARVLRVPAAQRRELAGRARRDSRDPPAEAL